MTEDDTDGQYDDEWFLRPYVLTGGRTKPSTAWLDPATVVKTVSVPEEGTATHSPEHHRICELGQHPVSIAEVSARLRLPLTVTTVLCSDLIESGYLTGRSRARTERPSQEEMKRVLRGLQKL